MTTCGRVVDAQNTAIIARTPKLCWKWNQKDVKTGMQMPQPYTLGHSPDMPVVDAPLRAFTPCRFDCAVWAWELARVIKRRPLFLSA